MKVIATCCRKGGTGKSTTTCAFADLFRRKLGKKVLLIDTDSQCNSTDTFRASGDGLTLYDLITDETLDPKRAIQHCDFVDIIPSSQALDDIETIVREKKIDYGVLDRIISKISGYDYIILDTGPALGFMLYSATYAADEILIVLKADRYSVQAFTQMMSFVYFMQDEYNPELTIPGVLLTQFKGNTNAHKAVKNVIAQFAESEGTHLINQPIRDSIVVTDAQMARVPVTVYDERHPVTSDYTAAFEEFVRLEEK